MLNESPARVNIDCRKYAQYLLNNSIRPKMHLLLQAHNRPCICIFHVTHTPESETYIKRKMKAFEREGFRVRIEQLFTAGSKEEIMRRVRLANEDPSVHGVIVQLPLT